MSSSQPPRQVESSATPTCCTPIQTGSTPSVSAAVTLPAPNVAFIYPPNQSPSSFPYPMTYQSQNRLPANNVYHAMGAPVHATGCPRPEQYLPARAALSPPMPVRYLPMPMFYQNFPLSSEIYSRSTENPPDGGNYVLPCANVNQPVLPVLPRGATSSTSKHDMISESASIPMGLQTPQKSAPSYAGSVRSETMLGRGVIEGSSNVLSNDESTYPMRTVAAQHSLRILSNVSSSSSSYFTPKSFNDCTYFYYSPAQQLTSLESSLSSSVRQRANSIGFEEPEILTAKNDSEDAHYMSDDEEDGILIKGQEDFLELVDENERSPSGTAITSASSSVLPQLASAHSHTQSVDHSLPKIDFDPRLLQRLTPDELHKLMSYRQAIMNLFVRPPLPAESGPHIQREVSTAPKRDEETQLHIQEPSGGPENSFLVTNLEDPDHGGHSPQPSTSIPHIHANVEVPKKIGRFQIHSVPQKTDSESKDVVASSTTEMSNLTVDQQAGHESPKNSNLKSCERISRFRKARIEECWEAWETSGLAVCDWRSKKTDNKLVDLVKQSVDENSNDQQADVDCQLCQAADDSHDELWKCTHKKDFTPYLDTNYFHKAGFWSNGRRQDRNVEQHALAAYDLLNYDTQEKDRWFVRKTSSASESLGSTQSHSSKDYQDLCYLCTPRKTVPMASLACSRFYHCHPPLCCSSSGHSDIDHRIDAQKAISRSHQQKSHRQHCHSASLTPSKKSSHNCSAMSTLPDVIEKARARDNDYTNESRFHNQNNRIQYERQTPQHVSKQFLQVPHHHVGVSKALRKRHSTNNGPPPGSPAGKDVTREMIHEQFINSLHSTGSFVLEKETEIVAVEVTDPSEVVISGPHQCTRDMSQPLDRSSAIRLRENMSLDEYSLNQMNQLEQRILHSLEESQANLLNYFREEIHKANVHINYLLEQNRLQQQCFDQLVLALKQHPSMDDASSMAGAWLMEYSNECMCMSLPVKLDASASIINPQSFESDANFSKFC